MEDGLAQILDLAPIMVRGRDGRITYWSRGSSDLYGWQPGEALGRLSFELLQTVFPRTLDEIGRALLRDGFWKGELRQRRKDGPVIAVSSHWILHGDETVEINAGIPEPRQDDSFAQSISQRLAASLGAIRNAAAGLIEDYEDWFDELSREEAALIVNEAARMESVIRELSNYNRIRLTGANPGAVGAVLPSSPQRRS